MRKNDSVSLVQRAAEKYTGDRKRLEAELKRLVKDGRKSSDLLMMGAAFLHLAELYHAGDDDHRAFSNAIRAVALLKDTDAYVLLVRAYMTLGQVYMYHENLQMAMTMDENAYRLVRKHRIKGQLRINVYNSLSANYYMLGDIRKSIHLLTECLAFLPEDSEEDLFGRARFMLNLAAYYLEVNEAEKARNLLLSMSSWVDKVEYQPLVCDYYLRCACIAYMFGDPAQGDSLTDTALSVIPRDVCPIPLYDDLMEVLKYLIERKDRTRAARLLDSVTAFDGNDNSTLQQIYFCRIMAGYHRVFGEPMKAIDYYKKMEELYEKQSKESRQTQSEQVKRVKAADAEIRKLKKEMQENEEKILLEPMTKLLNRSALLKVSSEFIESAAKMKQKIGAIFIDIDFFKECNDTYGHAKGDEIIREVANACRKEDKKNVRFARYGGDEFFGITRGLSDDAVTAIARRIAGTVRKADIPNVKNPNGGRVTLSIGVVNMAINDRTNTILDIAQNADKALYYAKNAGKNAIYRQIPGGEYVRVDDILSSLT
ncbi:MAG: GGDEF domain-containing protein [Lachnospiraceae bacterium]|nr:GGDEF domain-containing protein [Lachnospiraceae bacterium]